MVVSTISRIAYISGIASVPDLTSSLAMGQTMDHIAAVILPVTASLFWGTLGYEAVFFVGVVVAAGLLIVTQGIAELSSASEATGVEWTSVKPGMGFQHEFIGK